MPFVRPLVLALVFVLASLALAEGVATIRAATETREKIISEVLP